uniref:Beta-2-glycoprotein 1 n=1 Tax=Callorhinchus milii TaxID=7868 RepID=A0A4W3K5X3_CALMI
QMRRLKLFETLLLLNILICLQIFYVKCQGDNYLPDPDMKCDQPPRVPSGDFIEFWKTTYDHGETRTFECQDYYILEGPNVVQCIEGQWTPTPTCREPCVVSLKIFQTNKINLKSQNNTKLYVRHGEYLEFICSAGHSIETGVSLKQYCFNGHMTFPTCYRGK